MKKSGDQVNNFEDRVNKLDDEVRKVIHLFFGCEAGGELYFAAFLRHHVNLEERV